MATKLEALHAQRDKLHAKSKRYRQLADDAWSQANRVEDEIRKEQLRTMVGQPVKRRYRSRFNEQLNDAVGTLLKVNRTRCVVDYGDPIGEWTIPIEDVAPVNEDQGWMIEMR